MIFDIFVLFHRVCLLSHAIAFRHKREPYFLLSQINEVISMMISSTTPLLFPSKMLSVSSSFARSCRHILKCSHVKILSVK